MGGWPHQTVDYDAVPVSVAPLATTLGGVIDVRLATSVSAVIANGDALQSLAVSAEASWDGASGWAALATINASQLANSIAPGDPPLLVAFDCQDLRFVRFRGLASGAGLTATFSSQRVTVLPHR